MRFPVPIAVVLLPILLLILPLSANAEGLAISSPALVLSPLLTTAAAGESGGLDLSQHSTTPSDTPEGVVTKPDAKGLRKDTFYFVFTQFFVIGVLYALPEDISAWSEEQKEDYSFDKYKENIQDIVWDEDRWYINYLLHPYWGGTYFVRARERGYDEDDAFWYSVLLSTMYEYGAEALFEIPSVQDLILTPGLGFFVGKYFMDVRNGIRAQMRAGHPLTTGDHAILIATDPLGAIDKLFDRMFGIKGDYVFSPYVATTRYQPALPDEPFPDSPRVVHANPVVVPGFQINMRW